jgi:hypothetical protein
MTGTYPNRALEVEKQGENLRSALRRITVLRETATGLETNDALFDWLIANYKVKAQELDDKLKEVESNHLGEALKEVDP